MSFRLRRAAAAVRSLCACVCMCHTVIVSRVAIAASAVASVASVVSVATVELVHVHISWAKCGHRALSSLPPFFGAPWGGVLAPACGCVAFGACPGRSLPGSGSRLPASGSLSYYLVPAQHPPTTHRWGGSGSLPCLHVASARGGQSAQGRDSMTARAEQRSSLLGLAQRTSVVCRPLSARLSRTALSGSDARVSVCSG